MALKKKKGGGEGGANWMDTYGDMVTLLLCFFVLLYSMSTIDQEKWMLIVQSFNKTALVSTDDTPRGPEGDGEQEDGGGMPATTEMDSAMEEFYEFLQTYAASASGDGEDSSKITVSQGDGLIYLAFDSSVFFNGDKWDLRPEGKAILDDIIPALEEVAPYIDELRVSGHTASAQGRYDVKWDYQLSSMRAVEVVSYMLQNSAELDPARVQAMGYGQWRPVAGNDDESERTKNRRVEMTISGKDLENTLSDSITQYYTTTGQERPGHEGEQTAP